jgi:hypothetical protein
MHAATSSQPPSQPPSQPQPQPQPFLNNSNNNNAPHLPKSVQLITQRLLILLAEEMNKTETQVFIKSKLIHPLIHLIYTEMFPYLAALVAVIILILLLSILTFMFFLLFYFRR